MVQQTSFPTWFSIGFFVLLALGLAFLSLVVVVTVVVASGGSSGLKRQLKSVGLVLLLVVPALAVVGLVGVWVTSVRVVSHQSYEFRNGPVTDPPTVPANNNQPATGGIADVNRSRHPAGVLRVRETLRGEPEWAKSAALPGDPGTLVPVSSQRFATLGEAEEDVTRLAVNRLKDFYRDEYPLPDDWNVPVPLIEQHAVNSLVGEEFDQDFGNGIKGKMYRAHLRLDLTKPRQALHESWHDQIVKQRLTMLGTGLGMVTVILAASAGYFRLNEMTHGQYGGRLKLAAAALIGAAGLGVLALV